MQQVRAGSGKGSETLLDREFSVASLSALRAAVLESATAAGLSSDRAIDVMLALHELAANVIRHGSGRGHLLVEATPQALRCLVSDAGSDGRPDHRNGEADKRPGRPSASWPVQHGHGLWLVRRTADQVQVTTGPAGSVVCVIFVLPGKEASAEMTG